jgi:alpha-L-arabinofuranosidase
MTSHDTSIATATLSIQTDQPKAISPHLWGIFFEDLNYAADGGLYAELIQNRSFEYQATEQPTWNNLTSWELVKRGEGTGSLLVSTVDPIHPNNPHFAVLEVKEPGEGVGLRNAGFGGIPVQAGDKYELSLFARTLFVGERWAPHEEAEIEEVDEDVDLHESHEYERRDAPSRNQGLGALIARLESEDGEVLAEATLSSPGKSWKRLSATLTATRTDENARFVLMMSEKGGLALDVISLFPQKTFCNRPNGLRADLAQVIADLQPKFVRFPGGCLVHGNGLNNMYRWKDTIGPIEQRREQPNLWGYHQTVGLGYFEYFQFCEDIGAKPLPVVPAAVCCQNAGYLAGGKGQHGVPLDEMPAFIQDVLDLIEWANGPTTSTWGAKRAAAGHPEPFGLEYLGVGNEDHITPVFKERFQMIYEAVKAKHPEITVVGTTGPFHSGRDYDEGWKIANELHVPMVDEHYYVEPEWCWQNLQRYDAYDRNKSAVYLGEYAAHEKNRRNTLRSALAEAAYGTSLERNGDVVRLASYAPLLCKRGHTQWAPDLIYFDNTTISLTTNYYVQQLFSLNAGDVYLPTTLITESEANTLAASCVRDSQSGDLIVKIVSRTDVPVQMQIDLSTVAAIEPMATCTVLSGDPLAENSFGNPPAIVPQTSKFEVGQVFRYEVPAHSLNVIGMKSQNRSFLPRVT